MAANPVPPNPNPNEKLVRVFDTEQESEALVVKALLESAGIDSKISGIDTSRMCCPLAAPSFWCARKTNPRPASCLRTTTARPPRSGGGTGL